MLTSTESCAPVKTRVKAPTAGPSALGAVIERMPCLMNTFPANVLLSARRTVPAPTEVRSPAPLSSPLIVKKPTEPIDAEGCIVTAPFHVAVAPPPPPSNVSNGSFTAASAPWPAGVAASGTPFPTMFTVFWKLALSFTPSVAPFCTCTGFAVEPREVLLLKSHAAIKVVIPFQLHRSESLLVEPDLTERRGGCGNGRGDIQHAVVIGNQLLRVPRRLDAQELRCANLPIPNHRDAGQRANRFGDIRRDGAGNGQRLGNVRIDAKVVVVDREVIEGDTIIDQ